MEKKVPRRGREVADEVILDFLLDFMRQHQHWPSAKEINACNLPFSSSVVSSRFLGMHLARHAARMRGGFLPDSTMKTIRKKRQQLVAQIHKHPKYEPLWRLKRTAFGFDPLLPGLHDIIYAYGTLDDFLRDAGLPPTKPNADDAIKVIQIVAEQMGRTPTLNQCTEGLCCYDRNILMRYFPSWNAFLRAAGLQINEEQLDKQSPKTKRAVAEFDREQRQKQSRQSTPRRKRPNMDPPNANFRGPDFRNLTT